MCPTVLILLPVMAHVVICGGNTWSSGSGDSWSVLLPPEQLQVSVEPLDCTSTITTTIATGDPYIPLLITISWKLQSINDEEGVYDAVLYNGQLKLAFNESKSECLSLDPPYIPPFPATSKQLLLKPDSDSNKLTHPVYGCNYLFELYPAPNEESIEVAIDSPDPIPAFTTINYTCNSVYDSQTHSYNLTLEWNPVATNKCLTPVTSLFDGFNVALLQDNVTVQSTFVPSVKVRIYGNNSNCKVYIFLLCKNKNGAFKMSYSQQKNGAYDFQLIPHSHGNKRTSLHTPSCPILVPWVHAPPTHPHIIQYSIDQYDTAHLQVGWALPSMSQDTISLFNHYQVSITTAPSSTVIYQSTVPINQQFASIYFPVTTEVNLFVQIQLFNDTCYQTEPHSCSSPWSESVPLKNKTCSTFTNNNATINKLLSSEIDALSKTRCLTACLDKYARSTVSGSRSNVWPLPTSIDQLPCSSANKVDLCYKGCVIDSSTHPPPRHFVCTYDCVKQCKDECGGSLSCRSGRDLLCRKDCDFTHCSSGCSILNRLRSTTGEVLLPIGLPTATPTMVINGGEYKLSIHSNHGNMGGATIGHTLILIKVIQEYKDEFYIIQDSLILDLSYFSCEVVQLSVAMVTSSSISNYSQPISLAIYGETLYPSHPDILAYPLEVEEDFRPGFQGHSILTVSWDRPYNYEYLDHYQVRVTTRIRRCGRSLALNIPKNATKAILKSKNGYDLPKFSCSYAITVQSFPSKPGDAPPTVLAYVRQVTKPRPLTISSNCSLEYQDPVTGIMTVHMVWRYTDIPSVIEATRFIQIVSLLQMNQSDIRGVKVRNPYSITLMDSVTTYTEQFTFSPIPSISGPNVFKALLIPIRSPWFSYRIIPSFHSCSVDVPSNPPSPIKIINTTITELSKFRINITILVTRPSKPYSAVINYEVVISDRVVFSNTTTSIINVLSKTTEVVVDEVNKFSQTASCLYIHTRARTPYAIGDWSTPSVLPMDSSCQNNEDISPIIASSPTFPVPSSPSLSSFIPAVSNPPSPSIIVMNKSTPIDYIISEEKSGDGIDQLSDIRYHATVSIPVLASTIVITLIVIAVSIILMALVILKYKKHRLMQVTDQEEIKPNWKDGGHIIKSHVTCSSSIYDEWELPIDSIVTDEMLSEGCFGQVYRGHVIGPSKNREIPLEIRNKQTIPVAIKLLKGDISGNGMEDFLKEIQIMKKISSSSSNHVIAMVGCVTTREPLCLVTSLASYGDLRTYLQHIRGKLNKEYVTDDDDPYKSLGVVSGFDLLSFAYQIASGMEYVSSYGIVHCDLAARNVLVEGDKTLKISDFGMSQFIGVEDTHVKTSRTRLPWKWMALESLQGRVFNTATDVWSYGITLWEIATLGGYPYPTVLNQNLQAYLENGSRLEKPSSASNEIYSVMLSCWEETTAMRPSFTDLKSMLGTLISRSSQTTYIDIIDCDDVLGAGIDNSYVTEDLFMELDK